MVGHPAERVLGGFRVFLEQLGCPTKRHYAGGVRLRYHVDHQKILSDKGGLFNRAARRLYLMPFTLQETERYLVSRGIHWSRYDIVECYMTMGGIPYYLKLLDNELSYLSNIDAVFFKPKGPLWDEFDHLYETLFGSSKGYLKIIEALATKKSGLTRKKSSMKRI